MSKNILKLILVGTMLLACRPDNTLIDVNFNSLAGVEKGDRVLFQGNKAGQVTEVQFNSTGTYTVKLEIDEGFANAVTEYSKFFVISDPGNSRSKSIDVRLTKEGGTPLASGSTVTGESSDAGLAGMIQKEVDAGLEFFKEQIDKFGRDLQSFPESQAYKDLKKSLEDLAADIELKEKQTRESLKREWLPKLQRELEDLRQKLKQMGREDELAPLDQEVERIQKM